MEHDVLLEMKNISKEFPGVKALDNVSLTVRRGTVHALMGENGAGKSTLMKCLFGMYVKDGGSISLEGKEINFKNSKEALENGVAMVHQELNQALKRSVMDNIWLGRYPKKGPMVDEKKMYDDTKALFDKLEIDVDPKRIMSTMPVSQRQMAEIAKAVSFNSKIIVFDEPTSSLTEELLKKEKREEPKEQELKPRVQTSFMQAKSIFQTKAYDSVFDLKKGMPAKAGSLDYAVGDTVRHIKFDVGIVEKIEDGGRDYEVTVNFEKCGVKKMFAAFAKLKKL